jgi:hypothetical protein
MSVSVEISENASLLSDYRQNKSTFVYLYDLELLKKIYTSLIEAKSHPEKIKLFVNIVPVCCNYELTKSFFSSNIKILGFYKRNRFLLKPHLIVKTDGLPYLLGFDQYGFDIINQLSGELFPNVSMVEIRSNISNKITRYSEYKDE